MPTLILCPGIGEVRVGPRTAPSAAQNADPLGDVIHMLASCRPGGDPAEIASNLAIIVGCSSTQLRGQLGAETAIRVEEDHHRRLAAVIGQCAEPALEVWQPEIGGRRAQAQRGRLDRNRGPGGWRGNRNRLRMLGEALDGRLSLGESSGSLPASGGPAPADAPSNTGATSRNTR